MSIHETILIPAMPSSMSSSSYQPSSIEVAPPFRISPIRSPSPGEETIYIAMPVKWPVYRNRFARPAPSEGRSNQTPSGLYRSPSHPEAHARQVHEHGQENGQPPQVPAIVSDTNPAPVQPSIENTLPSWASLDLNQEWHRRARKILGNPLKEYPLGEGCKRCRLKKRICTIAKGYRGCASCTASKYLCEQLSVASSQEEAQGALDQAVPIPNQQEKRRIVSVPDDWDSEATQTDEDDAVMGELEDIGAPLNTGLLADGIPEWASKNTHKHDRARRILAAPTRVFKLGEGCKSCIRKNRVCAIKIGLAACAGCTAAGTPCPLVPPSTRHRKSNKRKRSSESIGSRTNYSRSPSIEIYHPENGSRSFSMEDGSTDFHNAVSRAASMHPIPSPRDPVVKIESEESLDPDARSCFVRRSERERVLKFNDLSTRVITEAFRGTTPEPRRVERRIERQQTEIESPSVQIAEELTTLAEAEQSLEGSQRAPLSIDSSEEDQPSAQNQPATERSVSHSISDAEEAMEYDEEGENEGEDEEDEYEDDELPDYGDEIDLVREFMYVERGASSTRLLWHLMKENMRQGQMIKELQTTVERLEHKVGGKKIGRSV